MLLAAVVVVIMWFGPSPAATQALPTVRATLTGFEETPMTLSSGGSGTLTAKISDGAIDYELTYEGLTGAFAAHIHLGRPGTTGGVIAFLCGGGNKPSCPASGGTVTGTIEPGDVIGPTNQGIVAGEFAELVSAILNGATYANVHTASFTGGEIRGQIRGPDFLETRP